MKTAGKAYILGTLVGAVALVSTLPSVRSLASRLTDNKVGKFIANFFAVSNRDIDSSSTKPMCIRRLDYLMKQKVNDNGNSDIIDSLIENALLAAYNQADSSSDGLIEMHLARLFKVNVEEISSVMRETLDANLPMAVVAFEGY